MNKIVLLGRLTRDPELTALNSGATVTKFTVAVNRKFKNADGDYEVDFINCTAWRKTGEFIAQYFSKGQQICLDGSLQIRKYVDREGNNRTAAEVVVDGADFCGSKGSGAAKVDNDPAGFNAEPPAVNTDDIPF